MDEEQQIRDGIVLIKEQPDQQGNLICDLFRILCDRLNSVSCFDNYKFAEVILKSKVEVAEAMIDGGLLSVIGDIIINKGDPYITVCSFSIITFKCLHGTISCFCSCSI